jgi:electron transport complex protein RnfB
MACTVVSRPKAIDSVVTYWLDSDKARGNLVEIGGGMDIYEKLATALEALPNGFPRTPSRTEISLLKKVFTAEEAELAAGMSRHYETAEEIAVRAGFSEDEASQILRGMVPRSLVKRKWIDGVRKFRLGPFVVGWYEAHMDRMDEEFARLFELYMAEGGGERILSPRPGVLGVVPARGSLKKELLQPYDDIDAHLQRHERFMVIDCVCYVHQRLLGKKCSGPAKRCAFVGLPPQAPLSESVLDREQALKLFAELEDQGMVHLAFYGFIQGAESPQFVGTCNCSPDCCGVLGGINNLGLAEGPQRSNYRAAVDANQCNGCWECMDRCPVHAIAEENDGTVRVNRARCIGCGQCVIKCSSGAVELVPVSPEEWFHVPSSFEEWEEARLRNMASEEVS